MTMQYHLTTLGCQMNRSDSERMRTVMEGMGYSWTDDEDAADVLGVLACSVRQKAIDKVYTRIYRWNQQKQSRNLLTFVTGCVLPDDRVKFLKLFDFVFTMNELPQFPDMVRQYGIVSPAALTAVPEMDAQAPEPPQEDGVTVISLEALKPGPKDGRERMTALWEISATPDSDFSAFVPIQNGCDKFCTFCAVPYTRGREVSRHSEDILSEVADLISRGYRSITLLGQNVNSYGRDRNSSEMSFAELLGTIGKMGDAAENPPWIYYTSPHPRDMSREVLEVMATYNSVARQVHLPLQSGDDRVLMRMNRQHSVSAYRESVTMIRDLMPEATLFTDIIVGFSGETEEQFENTIRAVEEFRFNMIYVAQYSPRPGAASSRWEDDIPHATKVERFHRVNDLAMEHSRSWNERYIGTEIPVLMTGFDRKQENMAGYTEGRINARLPGINADLIGRVIDLRVSEVQSFCLFAPPGEID